MKITLIFIRADYARLYLDVLVLGDLGPLGLLLKEAARVSVL